MKISSQFFFTLWKSKIRYDDNNINHPPDECQKLKMAETELLFPLQQFRRGIKRKLISSCAECCANSSKPAEGE